MCDPLAPKIALNLVSLMLSDILQISLNIDALKLIKGSSDE